MQRSEADWLGVLVRCQVKPSVAAQWAPVFADTIKPGSFSQGDAELDDFLGQILHESAGLTRMVENLSYSPQRICKVWPTRFRSLSAAAPYAYAPQALANYVYGRRMGNVLVDDGWRYRGRTPIMVTGKANYQWLGDLMGQDLVVLPELLEQPRFALDACIHWWEDRIPDSMLGDPEAVTRRVNGGLIGLSEREHLAGVALEALA